MDDVGRFQRLFHEMDSGSALHEIDLDEAGNPADYRFLAINPAFERQTGLVAANVIGRTVREIMPGIEQNWIDRFGAVAVTGEQTKFESFAADLGKHYQVTAYCPERGRFAVIFNDVTRLKNIEAELKTRQNELEAANLELIAKNAELERFNYTVSHDLKSPLITIKGFLGMLQQDLEIRDTDAVAKDIKFVCEAADTMESLLDDILELSRIGRMAHKPETISMSDVAHEALKLVQGQVRERGVQVDIQSDMPLFAVDRRRLTEVYQNLLDNAVKFMGTQKQPKIVVGCETRDGRKVLFVKDNGCGIDARYLDKIFGLFEQLDQRIPGTGIGLALVARVVETHGGTVWAESPGKDAGTTICFTLNGMEENKDVG